jgi:hypothetical protein
MTNHQFQASSCVSCRAALDMDVSNTSEVLELLEALGIWLNGNHFGSEIGKNLRVPSNVSPYVEYQISFTDERSVKASHFAAMG